MYALFMSFISSFYADKFSHVTFKCGFTAIEIPSIPAYLHGDR